MTEKILSKFEIWELTFGMVYKGCTTECAKSNGKNSQKNYCFSSLKDHKKIFRRRREFLK